jgi:hypothetical protein
MIEMLATLIGSGIGALIVGIGGVVVLSGRLSRLEQEVRDLPKTLNGSVVRPHEDRCINFMSGKAAERAITSPRIQAYSGEGVE